MTDEAKRVVDGMREGNFTHLANLIESLYAELEHVKCERDAAVEDLRTKGYYCEICANYIPGYFCIGCINKSNWQWRGVKEG